MTTNGAEPGAEPVRFSGERWLDKKGLAAHLGCSVSWIEKRMPEGLPSWEIAGRIKFRASEVEEWLQGHGHMRRVA